MLTRHLIQTVWCASTSPPSPTPVGSHIYPPKPTSPSLLAWLPPQPSGNVPYCDRDTVSEDRISHANLPRKAMPSHI
jgi:hypothetical protein